MQTADLSGLFFLLLIAYGITQYFIISFLYSLKQDIKLIREKYAGIEESNIGFKTNQGTKTGKIKYFD